jgi:hypothetical protein
VGPAVFVEEFFHGFMVMRGQPCVELLFGRVGVLLAQFCGKVPDHGCQDQVFGFHEVVPYFFALSCAHCAAKYAERANVLE